MSDKNDILAIAANQRTLPVVVSVLPTNDSKVLGITLSDPTVKYRVDVRETTYSDKSTKTDFQITAEKDLGDNVIQRVVFQEFDY